MSDNIGHRAEKGNLHRYTRKLVAFECTGSSSANSTESGNLLIFFGGLGDGLFTVPLANRLVDTLPPNWSLVQALLSSSYNGWGTGSIAKDASQIAACVSYFRAIKSGKIVIMGHSTGSQDVLEYLTGKDSNSRPQVDGAILQAPVSDREGMVAMLSKEEYDSTVLQAQDMVKNGQAEGILPSRPATLIFGSAPVCARRWLSLASPDHDSDDDMFSSDLTDTRLESSFGKLPASTPVCILMMGSDEFMPPSIDKRRLFDRWMSVTDNGTGDVDNVHSGIVSGATHTMKDDSEETKQDFSTRVNGFLAKLSHKAVL